jgi:hypothetical protein
VIRLIGAHALISATATRIAGGAERERRFLMISFIEVPWRKMSLTS